MNANTKKLKKMATWTIVVFATVFAVFMPLFWLLNYVSGVTAWKILLAAFATGKPIFLITAVSCLVIYFSNKY